MGNPSVPQTELEKLQDIFKVVEPAKQKLVEKLLQEAAFLADQNDVLRGIINKTGMIKVHPVNPELQKQTESAKQYLKNLTAYAIVIKTLNSVLTKYAVDDEDEYDAFENDES